MIADLPVFGAYRAERLLGSGSFADVFLCYHAALDTRVAVKVLHPHLSRQAEIRNRFINEAQILWRADHDRVIQVTHVDQADDGRPYFVMRHADRGSLDDVLAERAGAGTPLSLAETVGYAVELAACLDVLRDRDVVHRDLKPSNVLVKSIRSSDDRRHDRYGLPANERLVLADFGLAKRLSEGTNLISHLGGTPWYMAPEMASLTASVDWRADQFAVGVLAYELANAQVPWPERRWEHVREVDVSQVDSTETRPDLPTGFDEVIKRAVQPDPMDRFDTPSEFAEALDTLLDLQEPRADADPTEIRSVVLAARRAVREPAAQLIADQALHRLQAPQRVVFVGANRLGPGSFALAVAGERIAPAGGGALGSVVTRISSGEQPRARALGASGDPVDGSLERNAAGQLEVSVPLAPWAISSLVLELDSPDLGDRELVDIPHSLVRHEPVLARSLVDGSDVVVVGLPTSTDGGDIAYREIQALLADCSVGPVAVVGVRQPAASTEAGRRTRWSQILPADDSSELRMYLDAFTRGPAAAALRDSAALHLTRQAIAIDDGGPALVELVASAAPADALCDRFYALRTVHLIAESYEPDVFAEVRAVLGGATRNARLGSLGLPVEPDRARRGIEEWTSRTTISIPSSPERVVAEQMVRSYEALHDTSDQRDSAPTWSRLIGGPHRPQTAPRRQE